MPQRMTIAQWKKAQEIGATHYQPGRLIDLLMQANGKWYGWLVELDGTDASKHDGWTELSEEEEMAEIIRISTREELLSDIKETVAVAILEATHKHFKLSGRIGVKMCEAAMKALEEENLL